MPALDVSPGSLQDRLVPSGQISNTSCRDGRSVLTYDGNVFPSIGSAFYLDGKLFPSYFFDYCRADQSSPENTDRFKMTSKLWTKICGIRDVETATLASRSGADAIGLNFYAPSPRAISVKTAAEIVKNLPASTTAVGLFVNHTVDEIEAVVNSTGIEILQLHGDETPEFLRELVQRFPGRELIWARRVAVGEISGLGAQFARCRVLGVSLKACLLDARVEGAFGGTGRVLPWVEIARAYDPNDWPALILAGGLTPENVREAIETVRPWGIDTASGVESEPGVKDPRAIERFLQAAGQAGHPNPSSGPSP